MAEAEALLEDVLSVSDGVFAEQVRAFRAAEAGAGGEAGVRPSVCAGREMRRRVEAMLGGRGEGADAELTARLPYLDRRLLQQAGGGQKALLVRYRGMVQDVLNPEYFVSVFYPPSESFADAPGEGGDGREAEAQPRSARFLDSLPADVVIPEKVFGAHNAEERIPLFCVPIPGESEWAKEKYKPDPLQAAGAPTTASTSMTAAQALAAATSEDDGVEVEAEVEQPRQHVGSGKKRLLRNEAGEFDQEEGALVDEEDDAENVDGQGNTGTVRMQQEHVAEEEEVAREAGSGGENRKVRRQVLRARRPRPATNSNANADADGVDEGDHADKGEQEQEGAEGAGGAGEAARQAKAEDRKGGATSLYDDALGPQPYPFQGEVPCIAKIYDPPAGSGVFRLNDVFEFIGVYAFDPSSGVEDVVPGPFEDDTREIRARHPPASLVPRLHVISYRRVASAEPVVAPQSEFAVPDNETATAEAVSMTDTASAHLDLNMLIVPPRTLEASIQYARTDILRHLTQSLAGDALAAEYTLLFLLGHVQSRDSGVLLGSFVLNLVQPPAALTPGADTPADTAATAAFAPPSTWVDHLFQCLQQLLPRATRTRVDVSSLNSMVVAPTQDLERCRMNASPLQLQTGTLALLDETTMTPGALQSSGIQAMQALRQVITSQELPLHIEYFNTSVPTDLSFLLCSKGKSVLTGSETLEVPLQQQHKQHLRTASFPAASPTTATSAAYSAATISPSETSTRTATTTAAAAAAAAAAVAATTHGTQPQKFEAAQPQEDTSTECVVAAEWDGSALNQARLYLAVVREQLVGMEDTSVTDRAEAEFVQLRQQDKRVTADDFLRWLTLARLVAASEGASTLQWTHWKRMRDMERARMARIGAAEPSSEQLR